MADKPFDKNKTYCNMISAKGSANRCCYDHDLGYSEPNGRSKTEIDLAFFKCLWANGHYIAAPLFTSILLTVGWYRWIKCRQHDKQERQRNSS